MAIPLRSGPLENVNKATSFTIQELIPNGNRLELGARALPYRPISFEGDMRAEFTWYPGNPIGTVQLLGAEEAPTVINGKWKDRFISADSGSTGEFGVAKWNGVQVANAVDLADKADLLRMRGQLLEVTWGTRVRRGILTKFRQTFDGLEDIEWEMHFGWISRGEADVPAVVPSTPDVVGEQGIWNDISQALETVRNSPPFGLVDNVSRRITDFTDNLQGAITDILDTLSSVANVATPVADALKRLAATTTTVQFQAESLVAEVLALPATLNFVNGLILTYGERMEAEEYVRDIVSACDEAARTAARQRQELARRLDPNILATILGRDGQDLRNVSIEFYGTPDGWHRIMSFNGLESSRLRTGQVVFIPQYLSGQEENC